MLVKSETKEYEIPYAEAFLKNADVKDRRIEMQLPEGLLGLDAPLTRDEKLEQSRGKPKT